MKYLLILSSFCFLFISCSMSSENNNEGVGIRVINNSEVDLDSLSFDISTLDQQPLKLVFTKLDKGEKSKYQYVESLHYVYYSEEELFFTNYFVGKTGNDQLLEVGWGFCGTGLYSKTVSEGKFSAIILETDPVNNRMLIEQLAE